MAMETAVNTHTQGILLTWDLRPNTQAHLIRAL